MGGLHIPAPRLVVLARSLSELQGDLETELSSLLGSKVRRVDVEGQGPYPYPADLFLSWTVLGIDFQGKPVEHVLGPMGRCGLYVGIRTPPAEDCTGSTSRKTKDGRFDIYQLGERGFDLARKHYIPAVLLDTYDSRAICDFVQDRSYARS